jgi:hypothetical protein
LESSGEVLLYPGGDLRNNIGIEALASSFGSGKSFADAAQNLLESSGEVLLYPGGDLRGNIGMEALAPNFGSDKSFANAAQDPLESSGEVLLYPGGDLRSNIVIKHLHQTLEVTDLLWEMVQPAPMTSSSTTGHSRPCGRLRVVQLRDKMPQSPLNSFLLMPCLSLERHPGTTPL